MNKKAGNWRIEETGTGNPSETCLLVVHPLADIDEIAEMCRQMYASHLKQVWIVFDTRCEPLHVKDALKIAEDVMPNLEYVVRFAHPFIIRLMGDLWREMKRYYEKRGRHKAKGIQNDQIY